MKFDHEKLRLIIETEFSDIQTLGHIESQICIGVVGNTQIHIVVTTDEDNKDENPNETYICIES